MYEITITVDSPEQQRILTFIAPVESHQSAWFIADKLVKKFKWKGTSTDITTRPVREPELVLVLKG